VADALVGKQVLSTLGDYLCGTADAVGARHDGMSVSAN